MCVLYMYQYIKLSGHFWAGCPLVVISSIDGGFVLKNGCGHPRYFEIRVIFFVSTDTHIKLVYLAQKKSC